MIKRIKATNFKIFKNLDRSCARLNLLTGVNGSGKSSLLQLLMLSCRKSCSEPISFESPNYNDIRYCFAHEDEEVSFSVEFDDDESSPLSYSIKKSDDDIGICLECSTNWPYRRNMSFVSTFSLESTLIHNNGDLIKVKAPLKEGVRPYGEWEGVDCFAYLNAFGDFGEETFRSLSDKTNAANTMRCGGNRLVDWVNYWLNRISPGASVSTESTMEGNGTVVHIEYNGRKFIPENASNGIYSIIHVLLAVLTASCEDIVLIQNPEAYLHPHAQSIIAEFLARAAANGVQLFVETYSYHLINGFRVSVKNGIISAEDVTIMEFSRKEIYNEGGGGENNEHEECGSAANPNEEPEESINNPKVPSEIYADVKDIKIDSNGEVLDPPQGFMTEWSNQLMALVKDEQ